MKRKAKSIFFLENSPKKENNVKDEKYFYPSSSRNLRWIKILQLFLVSCVFSAFPNMITQIIHFCGFLWGILAILSTLDYVARCSKNVEEFFFCGTYGTCTCEMEWIQFNFILLKFIDLRKKRATEEKRGKTPEGP